MNMRETLPSQSAMAWYGYQRDSTFLLLGFLDFLPPSLTLLVLLLELSLANLAWITQQHSSRDQT